MLPIAKAEALNKFAYVLTEYLLHLLIVQFGGDQGPQSVSYCAHFWPRWRVIGRLNIFFFFCIQSLFNNADVRPVEQAAR